MVAGTRLIHQLNDESADRREIHDLSAGCHNSSLALNVTKTKKLLWTSGKRNDHTSISMNWLACGICQQSQIAGCAAVRLPFLVPEHQQHPQKEQLFQRDES